jgi:protease I
MLTSEKSADIIKHLKSWQRDSVLQPILSVYKALEYFGLTPINPDEVFSYIKSLHDSKTGGFIDPATGNPAVLNTAAALLILNHIGAKDYFNERIIPALNYMNLNAQRREEHFMLIGVIDECKITSFYPASSIIFFREMEQEDGSFSGDALNNAIAASALLRIGERIKNPEKIKSMMLSAQQQDGGFTGLWTSYCVMRTLDLLKTSPDVLKLHDWILNILNTTISVNETYQCLSILNWISSPVIEAAKTGDINRIQKWLEQGGSPDLRNLERWTPLMAASVRGRTSVVEFLLKNRANPKLRLEAADASAIFWAGQSGDINTAKALLKHNHELLFEISRVNGHNILLQAAFYGSQRHLEMAKWILENVGEADKLKICTATNVRGLNALAMASFWGNKPMEQLISQHDKSTEADRQAYLNDLLKLIAEPNPDLKTEQFIKTMSESFSKQNFDELKPLLAEPGFNINLLGGPLSGTPIIIAVTGQETDYRYQLAKFLLDNGANPDIPEKHPMAVDAVIRAAVLNNFNILKLISEYMQPLAFMWAMNEKPAINGQTALQDTVHRALTSDNNTHLEQIKWCISKGARSDIKDHTGTSPEMLARQALNDAVYNQRAEVVINALGISNMEELTMEQKKKKIGVLIESDFYENEIFYYKLRFAEEEIELHFLTRLWGQQGITFHGHEYKVPFECRESFENMDDETLNSYDAIIVPAGYVSDRLRFTTDINQLPPACEFLKRVFANKNIIKGIICHGMWLMAPISELIEGRKVVVHNNLLGDAKNMGAEYVDQDVVVDGDLVTARTGGHCHLFAQKLIEMI